MSLFPKSDELHPPNSFDVEDLLLKQCLKRQAKCLNELGTCLTFSVTGTDEHPDLRSGEARIYHR